MRLPNYDNCSLQELYGFLAERHIHVKFTRAQAHTKTLYKRDKEERRKLTAALDKTDAATTISFMELPPELRDQIYECILEDITTSDLFAKAELRERMSRVSTQFWAEARDVLNRGDYNTIPELEDALVEPLTPAQETCTCSTRSMAPDIVATNTIVPDHSIYQMGLLGSMGSGKSSTVLSLPQAVSEYQEASASLLGRIMAYRAFYAPNKRLPHQDLERSLTTCFGKLLSMQGGVDGVLQLIPTSKPSQQTLRDYMKSKKL